MDAIRIAILGILAMLMIQMIRPKEPMAAMGLSLACAFLILCNVLGKAIVIFTSISDLLTMLEPANSYLAILIKAVGITMITEFSAAICRENGMLSIADGIRTFGKMSVLLLGVPILSTLLEMIGGLTL